MKIYSSQLNFYDEINKAESGDITAMIQVAFAILRGNCSKDIEPEEAERAIRYYWTAVEAGNKSAMLDLAACYMDGRGVKRDVEKSLQLYQMGYDPDSGSSCFCLGCINRYDYGEGGIETPVQDSQRIADAFSYFQRGVELENTDCMYELGEMFFQGIGTVQDYEKALPLFQEAADFRDPDILSDRALRIYLRLAECNFYGYGTWKDIRSAERYITAYRQELRRRVDEDEESDWVLSEANDIWQKILSEVYKED